MYSRVQLLVLFLIETESVRDSRLIYHPTFYSRDILYLGSGCCLDSCEITSRLEMLHSHLV